MSNSNIRTIRVAFLLAAIVTGLMGASIYKIVSLKLSPPAQLLAATVTVNSTSRQLAIRGRILDRKGRILAASRTGFKLFVDPSIVEDFEMISFELGEILSMPPSEIEQTLRSKP